ncbi:MAG: type I pantothenate kinase [Actinomycetota bacterium]
MDDAFAALADAVADALSPTPPHIVAIGGAVAVGKSTIAGELARELERRGRRVVVVATDAFLLSNTVLHERGLGLRKGFPESFDLAAVQRFIGEIRAGAETIRVPVYSHRTYDVVPDEALEITRPDLVVLEGVIALHPPVADAVDVGVYVNAEEEDVREWFVDRFRRLTAAARDDPSSFYHGFSAIPDDQLTALATSTWDSINGVNLHEHILPSRERAGIIVDKTAAHAIAALRKVKT